MKGELTGRNDDDITGTNFALLATDYSSRSARCEHEGLVNLATICRIRMILP